MCPMGRVIFPLLMRQRMGVMPGAHFLEEVAVVMVAERVACKVTRGGVYPFLVLRIPIILKGIEKRKSRFDSW